MISAAPSPGTRLGRAAPYLVLAALTALSYLQLLASSPDVTIDTPDITRYFAWLHGFSREHLLAGRVPLWNPFIYAGTPFAANPQTGVFYPLSWLYVVMPVLQAQKWMLVLHVYMGGCFCYLYLRRVGIHPANATIACLPWMFGSWLGAHLVMGHVSGVFVAAWLPLILYLYEGAITTRQARYLFWTGFALGIQLLAGEPQLCYYTALVVVVYGGIRLGWSGSTGPAHRRWVGWIMGIVLIAVVAGLTAGIQLLPTIEFALHSDRAANSYDFATRMSMAPGSFVLFLIPWSLGVVGVFHSEPRVWLLILDWSFAGYVGITTLVLAALSVGERHRPVVRATAAALALGLVLALGRYTPFYEWLLLGLPGLRLFRVPARALILVVWALTVLSAFGLQWLLCEGHERWRSRLWRGAAMGGLLAALLLLTIPVLFWDLWRPVTDTYGYLWGWDRLTLGNLHVLSPLMIIAATFLAILLMGGLPRKRVLPLLGLLVAADLLVSAPVLPLAPLAPPIPSPIRDAMRENEASDQGPVRFDLSSNYLESNLAMNLHLSNVNGYWSVALRRFFKYVHAMRGVEPAFERHQLYDHVYKGPQPFPIPLLNVRWATTIDSAGKAKLVRADVFLPRAWLVGDAEVIFGEPAVLDRLRDATFDPVRTVLLETAPRLPLSGAGETPGRVRVRALEDGTLEIHANATRNAYLVLSEMHYPGWRAYVDGRDVPLERADYLITALPLTPGEHHILYRYEPASFRLGALATALACLAALAVGGLSWRSDRRAHGGLAPGPDQA